MLIAAIFVETSGCYSNLADVDPWDVNRDARTYPGPYPVVAHPPCQRWGRYWSGGPSAKTRRVLGDDAGCFKSALYSVERFGGVLEHPEASHAFSCHGLFKPPRSGGWMPSRHGWVCCVEQGHYGHPARKATWLYAVTKKQPTDLIWGPSAGQRLDEGFHSNAERVAARAAGIKPRKRLSARDNSATPHAFRDILLKIARDVAC